MDLHQCKIDLSEENGVVTLTLICHSRVPDKKSHVYGHWIVGSWGFRFVQDETSPGVLTSLNGAPVHASGKMERHFFPSDDFLNLFSKQPDSSLAQFLRAIDATPESIVELERKNSGY